MNLHAEAVARDWRRAERLRASGEIFDGIVSSYNARGLVVRFGTLHGLVPLAEIATRPTNTRAEHWPSSLVNRTLQLKVVEADQVRRRLIFSEQ